MSRDILSCIPNDISLIIYKHTHKSGIQQCIIELFSMLMWNDTYCCYTRSTGDINVFNFRHLGPHNHLYTVIWKVKKGNVASVHAFVPDRYKYSSGKWDSEGYR